MKKILLSFAALAMYVMANAQTRYVFIEEFTGENCPPCAYYNPGFWTLMESGSNPTEVLAIRYMAPIPSAGNFYYQDSAEDNLRMAYYGVNFTPNAHLDGLTYKTGNIADIDQPGIDAEYAKAAPFNISVSAAWSTGYDSVTTTIKVTAASAYAPAGGKIKLRAALVETVSNLVSIGNNGEKTVENVVRHMYPDPNGTSIASSWAMGDTASYTLTGPVTGYVDRNGQPFMVVWIQNDNDSTIAQVAKSAPLTASFTTDLGVDSINKLYFDCTPASGATLQPTMLLHNYGTSTITSATIYYSVNGGTLNTQAWSGSLAPGATQTYSLSIPETAAGMYNIYDSVSTAGDINPGNNVANINYGQIWNQEAGNSVPIHTGFEAPTYIPSDWFFTNDYDPYPNNEYNWGLYWSGSTTKPLGHNGSTWAAAYVNYFYKGFPSAYVIMPTPALSGTADTLSFWVAYAQATGTENDQLAVVYSTDCSNTWNVLWSKSGSSLATSSPVPAGTPFAPFADSEWVNYKVDLSSVPANAVIAFRSTSDGGNFLWLDDVDIYEGTNTSVKNVIAGINNVTLYPNPATEAATLGFSLDQPAQVQISVVDAMGRVVSTIPSQSLNAGAQKVVISTSDLASGIYNVKIQTQNGSMYQRLSVVK